jgi:hypothetical protein
MAWSFLNLVFAIALLPFFCNRSHTLFFAIAFFCNRSTSVVATTLLTYIAITCIFTRLYFRNRSTSAVATALEVVLQSPVFSPGCSNIKQTRT